MIKATKVGQETCSCNNCDARNFKSENPFLNYGKYVENLYKLRISQTIIHLCPECLRELETNITECLKQEEKTFKSEPIIDKDTFEKVQEAIKRNKE